MMNYWRILTDLPFTLLIAQMLFAAEFKKKKLFWLRALVFAIPFCFIYMLLSEASDQSGSTLAALSESKLFYPIVNAIGGLWMAWCYQCSLDEILCCAVCAYATQNIQYKLTYNIKVGILSLDRGGINPWQHALLGFCVMAIVYLLVYRIFSNRIRNADYSHIDRSRLIVNGLLLIIMTTFFIPEDEKVISLTRVLHVVFNIAFNALILHSQYGLLNEGKQRVELDVLEQVLRSEEQQARISEETIQLLNMKCHDLRQMVASVRANPSLIDSESLREVEEAIQIYDNSIDTGNKTLDAILMEKQLLCMKRGIRLICIADGSLLSFMRSADIYSLFGNALNNAIEGSIKEEDEQKRLITLEVGRYKQMIRIRIENNFVGEISLTQDGLLATDKSDKRYHGFGLLSIRYIARKYGGEMSIATEDQSFRLNILIPLPPVD